MPDIQEIFNRMQVTKKEQKDLKAMHRDALANSSSYKEAVEELKTLREKKKKIEEAIKDDFRSELDKLDVLKTDLENDKMLMADAAMTKLVKGESIEIVDEYDNKYEPIFSVQFKKL